MARGFGKLIEYSPKCIIPGGVCDWGQLAGDALSPWGPALPVDALALHRAITFAGVPERPSLGSVWDPARLPTAALCQEVAVGGHSRSGSLPGLDTPVYRAPLPLGLPALPVQPRPGCLWDLREGRAACMGRRHACPRRLGRLGWEQPSRAGAQAMRRPSHEE